MRILLIGAEREQLSEAQKEALKRRFGENLHFFSHVGERSADEHLEHCKAVRPDMVVVLPSPPTFTKATDAGFKHLTLQDGQFVEGAN